MGLFISFKFHLIGQYFCSILNLDTNSFKLVIWRLDSLGQYPSPLDLRNTLPLIILVMGTHWNLPLKESQNHPHAHNRLWTSKDHFHLSDTCPQIYLAMWCGRVALRQLQRVTPLNTPGGLTSFVQREMSTQSRVYITRQIPPEGLRILRESGQWVMVSCWVT